MVNRYDRNSGSKRETIIFYSFILMKLSCRWLRETMLPFNMFWIILNWTFRLPPKRQLSILLKFFAINKFVFDFCCLCLLCYNAGHHAISRQKHGIQHEQGYIQCMPLHIGDPVLRTDGWTDGHVTITSPLKFLGFTGYQNCLAMVLRWRASARAPL